MNIEAIRDALPDYARDLRLNLGSVLTTQGAPGLTARQIWGTALASALASRNATLITAIEDAARAELDAAQIDGAKAAAAIMAMNNIYYRFTYMASRPDYKTMPAKLRMNVIGTPGIEKADFELYSLAVSAVNGCGMCIDAHDKVLAQHVLVAIMVLQRRHAEGREILRLAAEDAIFEPRMGPELFGEQSLVQSVEPAHVARGQIMDGKPVLGAVQHGPSLPMRC